MLITLSRICQSLAEIKLTCMDPLGALSLGFDLFILLGLSNSICIISNSKTLHHCQKQRGLFLMLNLSLTRNHMVMHRTQRNGLNVNSGNTPLKYAIQIDVNGANSTFQRTRFQLFVKNIYFWHNLYTLQYRHMGSELYNTGDTRLVSASTMTVMTPD